MKQQIRSGNQTYLDIENPRVEKGRRRKKEREGRREKGEGRKEEKKKRRKEEKKKRRKEEKKKEENESIIKGLINQFLINCFYKN